MPILRCKLTFGLSLLLLSFKHVQNGKCECSLGTELLCNESRRIRNALLSSGFKYQQKFPSSILPSSVNLCKFSPLLKFIIVHSRNKITIRQQQPSIGPNWIHFKRVRSVFFAAVVRLECSSRNMHQITHANSFSQFLSYSKIKRQKDAISPNGLSSAHAQGVM